ncbi:hypothetical protein KIN20_030535 [Parelaphostrongylus tenuis]|uniref:Uncharacterized protein n=1 Tax=Parelaphostrongylus tenuis TaxID=148309 RepID=A0AAD5R4Y6_PARTN|nr:hypothetical protein KIN20_030535 [Parelaphostrongylus tenuis]
MDGLLIVITAELDPFNGLKGFPLQIANKGTFEGLRHFVNIRLPQTHSSSSSDNEPSG